ncbi:MAG: peptidoglycan DD-metalloendopeptidase family protein [Firmicutes bacterium]|nr:peptidoglycan DD-metalloendopeptidase family protein [Bacillota bacterium]
MKKKTAVIISFMLAICFSFGSTAVYATPLSELQDEIDQKQEELKEGQAKEKDLSNQVNSLEETIYELNDQIETSEGELEVLKKDLKEAQEKVDAQNEELGIRLRAMYKNGSVGFMDVLMNSNSFSEFLTNMDLVQKIYASDKDVLEELQDSHDKIEKKKNKVEKLSKELKDSKQVAQANMETVEAEKQKIAKDNEKTAAMLDDLENEAAAEAARLASSAQSGETSSSSTSSYGGGAFAWPVPSSQNVSSGYGWRICPFHGREFHGGIDVAANGGAAIVACADGKVISVGWNGGFGNSIKVDHGGGLVTMYNHCSGFAASVGQTVSKGQTIAYVGTTGSSTGNHLDFRVFKDGTTQNPFSYL